MVVYRKFMGCYVRGERAKKIPRWTSEEDLGFDQCGRTSSFPNPASPAVASSTSRCDRRLVRLHCSSQSNFVRVLRSPGRLFTITSRRTPLSKSSTLVLSTTASVCSHIDPTNEPNTRCPSLDASLNRTQDGLDSPYQHPQTLRRAHVLRV